MAKHWLANPLVKAELLFRLDIRKHCQVRESQCCLSQPLGEETSRETVTETRKARH